MTSRADILYTFLAAVLLVFTTQAHALPESYVYGFLTGGLSASTSRTVEPGIARDSTNTFDLKLTSNSTTNLSVSGAGGLDTGTVAANTWYAHYVIGDSGGTNSTTTLFSTSFSSPTLPSGYDKFRRIGSARTTAASVIRDYRESRAFTNATRLVYYVDDISNRVALSGGSATTKTAVDLSAFVPPSVDYGNGDVLLLVEQGGPVGDLTLRSSPFNLDTMFLRSRNDAQVLFPATDWKVWYLNDSPTASTTIWVQGYMDTL